MSRSSNTHIFRAQLRPRVYRDIEIESTKSLYDLAAAIVQAFDFDFDHAFGFYSKLGSRHRVGSGLSPIGTDGEHQAASATSVLRRARKPFGPTPPAVVVQR